MARLRRQLLNLVTVLSLFFCAAIVLQWLRSYVVTDHQIIAKVVSRDGGLTWSQRGIHVGGGSVMLGTASDATPDGAMAAQLVPFAGRGWTVVYSRSQPSALKTLWCAPTNALGFASIGDDAGAAPIGWGYQRILVIPFWFLAAACAVPPAPWLARRSRVRAKARAADSKSTSASAAVPAAPLSARRGVQSAARRRVVAALTLLSVPACLAILVLWGRSLWTTDWASLRSPGATYNLLSYRGWVIAQRADVPGESEQPGWRGVSGSDLSGVIVVPCLNPEIDTFWSRVGLVSVPAAVPWDEPDTTPSTGAQTVAGMTLDCRNVWLPHGLLALATAYLPARWTWRSSRAAYRARLRAGRAARGLCPGCAYDLRASAARCPECGEPTTMAARGGTCDGACDAADRRAPQPPALGAARPASRALDCSSRHDRPRRRPGALCREVSPRVSSDGSRGRDRRRARRRAGRVRHG